MSHGFIWKYPVFPQIQVANHHILPCFGLLNGKFEGAQGGVFRPQDISTAPGTMAAASEGRQQLPSGNLR